jgi:hypothetical protein
MRLQAYLLAVVATLGGAAALPASPTEPDHVTRAEALGPEGPDSRIRVNLHPTQVPVKTDDDWVLWNMGGSTSSSLTSGSLSFTLSASTELSGTYYKYQYTRAVAHLGERAINKGISTITDSPSAMTLTIKGLSAGTHTLLTWHNAWDKLTSTATLSISVTGGSSLSVSTNRY